MKFYFCCTRDCAHIDCILNSLSHLVLSIDPIWSWLQQFCCNKIRSCSGIGNIFICMNMGNILEINLVSYICNSHSVECGASPSHRWAKRGQSHGEKQRAGSPTSLPWTSPVCLPCYPWYSGHEAQAGARRLQENRCLQLQDYYFLTWFLLILSPFSGNLLTEIFAASCLFGFEFFWTLDFLPQISFDLKFF